MHIGKHIKAVMLQQQRGATWLASNLPCERTNIYNIFNRHSIDTELLQKISILLNHDFFKDLSNDTFHSQSSSLPLHSQPSYTEQNDQ